MSQKQDTPPIVAKNLKRYLKSKGTLKRAAEILGIGPTTVSNQLNGKTYFTRKNAARYADAFGVNPNYLSTGMGNIDSTEGTQKDNYSIYTPTLGEKTNGEAIEESIILTIKAKLIKLDEIAYSYYAMEDSIRNLADLFKPDSKYYDFCQIVRNELENSRIEPVATNVAIRTFMVQNERK